MTSFISFNQSVEVSVIQAAYQHWFVSCHQEQAIDEPEDAEAKYVYFVPPAGPVAQLELFAEPIIDDMFEFVRLVSQWRIERGSTSSTTDIVLCPSYQSIIGMGAKAVRLILAQMQSEGDHPDHWFWALQVLTKANPVSDEDEGDFRKMAQSWFQWARRRYVW
jgi:hypothetical protein